jgi:drug/metabolite transporter (DMT)-like permease
VSRNPRNWKLGFGLALTTAMLWGVLPIALKVALTELDAWTITWCRFAGALLAVGIWLTARGELPVAKLRDRQLWRWLIPGSLGLTFNYVLYVMGLKYTSPAVAQVVMQIAPLMLLAFGMVFFRERFSRLQWFGFLTLLVGLLVFFNEDSTERFRRDESVGTTRQFLALAAECNCIHRLPWQQPQENDER